VEGDALDRACEGLQGRSLISGCGAEHLVHGACREVCSGSWTVGLDGTNDEDALLLESKCSRFVSGLFCGDSLDLSVATGTSRVQLRDRADNRKNRAK
jgi:hypothetical protein